MAFKNQSDMEPEEFQVAETESMTTLTEYWDVCRRRVGLIVGLVVVCGGVAALWSFNQIPQYQARAEIVIEPRDPKVLLTGKEQDYSSSQITNEIETHIRLMKSYPVIKETSQRVNITQQPEYQPKPSRIKQWISRIPFPWVKDVIHWGRSSIKKVKAFVKGQSSRKSSSTDDSSLTGFPAQAEQDLIQDFSDHISISHVKGSKLVEIRVDSQDPTFAARTANALATVYIEQTLARKVQVAESAAQWFELHLDDLRKKVEKSEQKLYAFRVESGLVDVSDQQSSATQRLAAQNTELVRAEMTRTEAQTRYQQIQSILSKAKAQPNISKIDRSDIDSLGAVLNSEVIRSLRTREIELSVLFANLSEKYGPLHPKMIQTQTELKELRTRIRGEVDKVYGAAKSEYELALARERAVRNKLDKQKSEKILLDQHAVKYSLLEREANSNRQLYDLFLTQMGQTGLSTEIKTINMSIAEPALPNLDPVKPKKGLNTLIGILLGLFSGVGLAFVLEYGGKTFNGPTDLMRYLPNLPFFGWVSRTTEKQRKSLSRVMELEPFGMLADQFRHIRTSVWHLCADQASVSLAITSPGEDEGKTTLAVNLSIALANLNNEKVVLIDADLRRPRIGKIFGLKKKVGPYKGLGHYLRGEANLQDIIYHTDIPNLLIIPAGIIPPNSSELLHSPLLSGLFKWCRHQQMRIIVDSPAILPVVDTKILAKHVSGLLLVVSAEQTHREAAKASIEQLEDHGGQVVGVVLQKVSPLRIPKYYHGKGYGASSSLAAQQSKVAVNE